ncbi:MAG: hypothetical protein NC092_12450 [Butyrivibrio sp.]|nr:hypothetical protein [Muribaculum sp.]MCM1553487.1 hypothetical protein [Butyrivibrio sp.]
MGSFKENAFHNLEKHKYILWYAVCALCLGIIDQRRNSAVGNIQMLFANLIGLVVFFMLIPSMNKAFFALKQTKVWGCACVVVFIVAVVLFRSRKPYWGQWNAAALSCLCIATLIIYIIWDRKNIFGEWRISKVCFGTVMLSLFLMLISINNTIWPGFYLMLFGCFYLIGIPSNRREDFMLGILVGMAAWFIGQQCLAFAFRPYDHTRYKGMYLGETQSGIFYMIAYCAFMGLWLYGQKKGWRRSLRILCFIMAAGCVSLLLLTGSKSSLLGAMAGTLMGYISFDVIMRKSFKHWLMQAALMGICALLLFPAAYGCVRYLPTVLHHPIWFDGEYNDEKSVRSFDPWNSERYVSFERAVNTNIGRILSTMKINLRIKDGKLHISTPLSIKSDAAEYIEPGSSREHPFIAESRKGDNEGQLDPARIAIWSFFLRHLNFEGHNSLIFYYREDVLFGNAHNMFLHIAVLYGIIPGILYLVWNFWCLLRMIRRRDMEGIVGAVFMTAIMTYGMFEQATTTGQITMSLLFLLYYYGMEILPRKGSVEG